MEFDDKKEISKQKNEFVHTIIAKSLNLDDFCLNAKEETECIEIFQQSGREQALQYATNIHTLKKYSSKIDEFYSHVFPVQKTKYEELMKTHLIVRAFMNRNKYLIIHSLIYNYEFNK